MSDENKSDITDQENFVPAVFARSAEEAEQYRQLFFDHDIEAIVGYEGLDDAEETDATPGGMTHGLPVLVQEMFLDEASEIVADREDQDEFEDSDEDAVADDDDDDEEFGMGPEDESLFLSEGEEPISTDDLLNDDYDDCDEYDPDDDFMDDDY